MSSFSFKNSISYTRCGPVVDRLWTSWRLAVDRLWTLWRQPGTKDRTNDPCSFQIYEACKNELTLGPLSICIRWQLVLLVYLCHKNKGIFLRPWLNTPDELYIWLGHGFFQIDNVEPKLRIQTEMKNTLVLSLSESVSEVSDLYVPWLKNLVSNVVSVHLWFWLWEVECKSQKDELSFYGSLNKFKKWLQSIFGDLSMFDFQLTLSRFR